MVLEAKRPFISGPPEAPADDLEADPLCCCEYKNLDGQRAHLCGLFCDCAELDDAVDRLISGHKMPENR